LFKGNQKVSLHLNNTADVHEEDEIKLMQRGRMLCSMQAWWFIWGYQNYPATEPSAKLIKAKLPYQVDNLAYENQVCDLMVYFARPDDVPELDNLTYTEFFALYDYARPTSGKGVPKRSRQVGVAFLNGQEYPVYNLTTTHFVRMSAVPFCAGEIFWLRVLLYRLPARGYDDLLTVAGVVCSSFQEAARRRRLVEDERTATDMYMEVSFDSTPHELRVLFTNMTLQGFPSLHIFDDVAMCCKMYDEFLPRYRGSVDLSRNRMLLELAKLFKLAASKTLSDYGLPEPEAQDTELQVETISYAVEAQCELAATLLAANPLTDEMHLLFDDIRVALQEQDSNQPFVAILQGIAGSGKSTFVKFLMAYIRSLGLVAKGCASTGLAASVYEDFSTAHSLFAIPVIEDEEDFEQEGDLQCNLHLKKYEQRRELLDAMRFCAWDEVSSQHMRDIRAAMAAMNGFRGKVLLFVGDGLQITPVVPSGNKAATCASSIYCSELMRTARYYQFTKILRLQNANADPTQASYARLLSGISRNCPPSQFEDLPPAFHVACDEQRDAGLLRLYIPRLRHFTEPEQCVTFCYPTGFNTNTMHMSCILAATNVQVDFWNAEVQKLNNNPEFTLLSKDVFDETDDPHGYLKAMVTEDVMNKYDDPGSAPPHQLRLKLHDICILMRAVSKADKLATNTRVRITGISENVVRVSTLDPDVASRRTASLPRFVFKIKLPYGKSYHITRRQFPLRLAYSLSMNRSQGQTLDRVVVDLTKHCFMHGHLNVAMSRIRDANNIAVYIIAEGDYDDANKMVVTTNVIIEALNIN
jgi:hypothetical protein